MRSVHTHTKIQCCCTLASGSPDDRCELWAGSDSPSQLCVCFLWRISLGCLSGWFLLLKHRTGCTADSSTCSSPQHKHLKYSKYKNHQLLISLQLWTVIINVWAILRIFIIPLRVTLHSGHWSFYIPLFMYFCIYNDLKVSQITIILSVYSRVCRQSQFR